MKIVNIFFPGEVIPKVILVLDESAGDRIINDGNFDLLRIHICGEILSFKEYSHIVVDSATDSKEEEEFVEKINSFINSL